MLWKWFIQRSSDSSDALKHFQKKFFGKKIRVRRPRVLPFSPCVWRVKVTWTNKSFGLRFILEMWKVRRECCIWKTNISEYHFNQLKATFQRCWWFLVMCWSLLKLPLFLSYQSKMVNSTMMVEPSPRKPTYNETHTHTQMWKVNNLQVNLFLFLGFMLAFGGTGKICLRFSWHCRTHTHNYTFNARTNIINECYAIYTKVSLKWCFRRASFWNE